MREKKQKFINTDQVACNFSFYLSVMIIFIYCKKDNKHVQEWHHGELKAPKHVFTMFTSKLEKSEKLATK